MVAMLIAQFPLKRFIATFLPVSFLWLFVACALICAKNSEQQHSHHTAISSTEITAGSDCEGCPLAPFLKATIPQHPTFQFDFQPLLIALPLFFSADCVARVATVSLEHRSHFPAPPLKRLPLLRI